MGPSSIQDNTPQQKICGYTKRVISSIRKRLIISGGVITPGAKNAAVTPEAKADQHIISTIFEF
jgi:hypothetical protein